MPEPTPPTSATTQTVTAVADVLAFGLSAAFPAGAAAFAVGDEILHKLAPWIIAVVEKKQFDMATLKAMQADLNSLGPSFPAVGGYSNAFAAGTNPAPGTTPSQAPPNTATFQIGGSSVTVTSDSLQGIADFIASMIAKKPVTP